MYSIRAGGGFAVKLLDGSTHLAFLYVRIQFGVVGSCISRVCGLRCLGQVFVVEVVSNPLFSAMFDCRVQDLS